MLDGLAPRRRRGPEDPVSDALAFYGLLAAAGFAAGWMAQALGGF
jgi:hypothetical protein